MAKKKPSKKKSPQRSLLPDWFRNQRIHLGLIFGLAFLLYGNTLTHQYTQDDAIVITQNMFTTQGLAGIPGILSKDTFFGFFKVEGKDKLVSGGRYRPLSLITFTLEWQLFKKKKKDATGQVILDAKGQPTYEGNPMVGHFMNIVFFGLTGWVLYLCLLYLFQQSGSTDRAYVIALVTALVFIAHPIHTEAVANIKGRDEIFTLLGSLAALYFSVRGILEKKPLYYVSSAVIFFLALLSKENAITFLAILPLTLFYFTKVDIPKYIQPILPLLGATILFLALRGAILGWSLGEPPMELMNNPYVKVEGSKYVPFTSGERLATVTFTLGKYVQLLFFPHPLTHDYYPRAVEIMTFTDWQVLLSVLLYLGLLGYAIWGLSKKEPLSYAVWFYLVTLSIVSNVVFPVGTNMAERLLFMPSVGFCLVIGILAWRLSSKEGNFLPQKLTPLLAGLGIYLLLLGGKTISRNFAWKDNFTLFKTDITTSNRSAKLLNALGAELGVQSVKVNDEAKRQEMYNEAEGYLQKAIEIHPNYENAYLQLGNINYYKGAYDQAVSYYQQVLRLDPDDPDGQNNMGLAYREGAKQFGEQGNVSKALEYLKRAQSLLGENDYETLRLLGVANGTQQNFGEAIRYFEAALKIEPNDANLLWNLGNTYYQNGQEQKGQEYLQRARELNPNLGQQR